MLDAPLKKRPRRASVQTIAELEPYFTGTLKQFTMPIRLIGTPFQHSVWLIAAGIPYGETISYAELARRIGSPSAVRAVGAANGRNRSRSSCPVIA
jgi:methylated-DNA-[protein]-cysteine S-methyltransferase